MVELFATTNTKARNVQLKPKLHIIENKSMYANVKAIFDYDASPAKGKGSTDVKYIVGVGWEF